MKKLAWLSAEDYATSPQELMVVSCMKGYLRSMPEKNALQKLSEIIKPKVIKLNDGGVPLPIQSVVDGAKFAAFIDEAVACSMEAMGDSDDDLSQVAVAVLKNIDGETFIQSMSVDVVQFIADAYRSLRY